MVSENKAVEPVKKFRKRYDFLTFGECSREFLRSTTFHGLRHAGALCKAWLLKINVLYRMDAIRYSETAVGRSLVDRYGCFHLHDGVYGAGMFLREKL